MNASKSWRAVASRASNATHQSWSGPAAFRGARRAAGPNRRAWDDMVAGWNKYARALRQWHHSNEHGVRRASDLRETMKPRMALMPTGPSCLSCFHHNEGRHAQEAVESGERGRRATAEDGMGAGQASFGGVKFLDDGKGYNTCVLKGFARSDGCDGCDTTNLVGPRRRSPKPSAPNAPPRWPD